MTNACRYDVCRSPSRLEIKTTRNAINVKHLTSEKEAGMGLAFQCLWINTIKGNAPTSDKLIFKSCPSFYLVDVITEDIRQTIQFLLV